jgi:hypothetical protein
MHLTCFHPRLSPVIAIGLNSTVRPVIILRTAQVLAVMHVPVTGVLLLAL